MPQEIRNCVYQGALNSALIAMNKDENWRVLFGQQESDSRMRDIEFILRFLALGAEEIKNSKGRQVSLKKYLNVFMGSEESNSPRAIEERKKIFQNTMQYIKEYLGENAFQNVSAHGSFIDRFHPTIFDAISIATAYAMKNDPSAKMLVDKRVSLLNDKDFKRYISERTTNIDHINGRIGLALDYLFGMRYE